MEALKLDHCVIHVSDWERSNRFYAAVLGAEILPRQNGFTYKLGDFLLNCHGPGIAPNLVARIPVQPGNRACSHRKSRATFPEHALDHDDLGLNQSKIINVIDSKSLERDASGKPRTLFLIPL
ncbi:MAG: VOC family protein [Methylovirgula sp.]